MKTSQLFEYILIAIITIGVFAAIAQNDYGFTLIGGGCMGLAALYLFKSLWAVLSNYDQFSVPLLLRSWELFLLAALILIFSFRALYIRFPGIEVIFMGVGLMLLATYLYQGIQLFKTTRVSNNILAWLGLAFFGALVLFIVALTLQPLAPAWSLYFGFLAGPLVIPLALSTLLSKKYDLDGNDVTLYHYLAGFKNKTILLFMFFIISGSYQTLAKLGWVPNVQDTGQPKDYIELVRAAEAGNETPVNGKYQHEIYKENMDKFLEKHAEEN